MEINSSSIIREFEECVKTELIIMIHRICENEQIDFNVIKEKYLDNINLENDIPIKKKRILKEPPHEKRCISYNADSERCKRSKKDDTDFCRRHQKKQTNGTIYDEKNKSEIKEIQESNSGDIDKHLDGNIIEFDNIEYIHIPSNNFIYSFDKCPTHLGYLDNINNKLIPL